MPYPVNNYTTTFAYADAGTCVFSPPRKSASLVVSTAAIYYQIAPYMGLRSGANIGGEQWGPETFATPGRYFFDEGDFLPLGGMEGMAIAIRVREAVSGSHAQVTIA